MQPTSRQAAEAIGINKSVRRNIGDQVIRLVLFLAASVSVITTAAVIYSLSAETISFFFDPAVSLRPTGSVTSELAPSSSGRSTSLLSR
jgi:ABC-type phosphate transport system permease subunit